MQNHDTVASLKRRGHEQVLQKSRVYGAGKYPEGERKRIFRCASKITKASPKSGARAIPEINP